jgi:tryptophan halogenase
MIKTILVLGGGSAGLIAATSVKRKIPHLAVRIVRSPEIGVIGVGEGTTPNFLGHLFGYLGIRQSHFYALAQPTWKLGVRFFWGPRERFDYSFAPQLDARWDDLPMQPGYYCDEEFRYCNVHAALMAHDKVFTRQPAGGPEFHPWLAFHIENQKLVAALELVAREAGVEITDARVSSAERGPQGISSILLEDGRRIEADLFVDASGFRSELLGRTLEEPFISFERSLFCDRAVIGGWERTTEPILPYTTAETMDAGWVWQIEHEHHVNRGYVYSSEAISDDEAAAEFLRKNPKAPASPRVVKFRSGRYRDAWVGNVVGIGNAGGFVEPLEATALMIVCSFSQMLVNVLLEAPEGPSPSMRRLFNQMTAASWDDIRDFLSLHYRLNTRLETAFWRHCREDTEIGRLAALVEFYQENGPTGLNRHLLGRTENNFGLEGHLVMLLGNRVPFRKQHLVTAAEQQRWNNRRAQFSAQASAGMNIREALAYIRHPTWRWNAEAPAAMPGIPPGRRD